MDTGVKLRDRKGIRVDGFVKEIHLGCMPLPHNYLSFQNIEEQWCQKTLDYLKRAQRKAESFFSFPKDKEDGKLE